MSFKEAIKKWNIDEDSELGMMLKKIDLMYAKEEKIYRQILKLKKEKQQAKEDAELMEKMLMHRFNKDTRFAGTKR